MANPRCTVKFVRTRHGEDAHLLYRGETLNVESVDPGERALTKHLLLKQCKERVAARVNFDKWDPGLFFRTLDVLRGRRRR